MMHEVAGSDVAESILDFARGVNATQIVIGTSRRSRLARLTRRGVGEQVAAASGDIDVHLVSHTGGRVEGLRLGDDGLGPRDAGAAGCSRPWASLVVTARPARHPRTARAAARGAAVPLAHRRDRARRRPAAGHRCAAVSLAGHQLVLHRPEGHADHPEPAERVGPGGLRRRRGRGGLGGAPRRTARRDAASRRSASRAVLAALAQSLLARPSPLPALLERARTTFGMRAAALVARRRSATRGPSWPPPGTSTLADIPDAAVAPDRRRRDRAGPRRPVLPADEQRLVGAFVSHAAGLLTRERLVAEAGEARGLARDNRARTALLAAVSHDLRTPLAGIKAAVSSLRQTDVTFSPEDEAELLESVEESADRLTVLIGNLLDMSRIQTGSITPHAGDLYLEDVVEAARIRARRAERVASRRRGPPPGARRRRPARPGPRQRPRERPAALPGRREVVVQAGRLATGCRSGWSTAARACPTRPRTQIFAPFQRGGDAPRARAWVSAWPSPGSHRGDGRHPLGRGHPRRRATMVVDLPRSRPPSTTRCGRIRAVTSSWSSTTSRTSADPVDQPAGPRLRGRDRRGRPDRAADPRRAHPGRHRPRPRAPDLDGVEVLRRLRDVALDVPVVVLSARHDSDDKVEALDPGADDYVTKPFGMDEFLARIRAAVRRGHRRTAEPPSSRPTHFTLDFAERRATATARRSGSPRPSGACSRPWPATPGHLVTQRSCSARSGARPTDASRTTSGCTRPAAPQARTRPRGAPLPAHRTGDRLPVRRLRLRTATHHVIVRRDAWRSGDRGRF